MNGRFMTSGRIRIGTDKKLWQWQAPAGRHSLGIYVTQGWLLVLAVGRTPLAALESWLLVLYAALGVALLLEQNGVTRRLFLGRPARPRHSDSESPALT